MNGNIPHTHFTGFSQETKDKIRNTLTGRKLSEEHKAHIGEGCKGKIVPWKGKHAWNFGLTKETSESVLKCSLKRTGKKRVGRQVVCEICGRTFNQFGIKSHIQFSHVRDGSPMKGRHQTQESKEKNRQKHLYMQTACPYKDTLPERIICTLLDSCDINYCKQYPILNLSVVDMFIEPNICIYIDGNYWHTLPGSYEKDTYVSTKLMSNDFIVLRLWENDIKNNLIECANRIFKCLGGK
jgi:very-short-patch-repair endonuclease